MLDCTPEIDKIAAALVKAQADVRGAAKDSTNPHLKNKYADLASVMDACRPALNAAGIAVLQTTVPVEAQAVCVRTTLLHESGQWVASTLQLPAAKADPQGYGSALTYARRYGLMAIVGVCPEDDDGEAATAAAKPRPVESKPRPAKPEPAWDANAAREQVAKMFTRDEVTVAFKGWGLVEGTDQYKAAVEICSARMKEITAATTAAASHEEAI